MWYEILVENEYAEYFINKDYSCFDTDDERIKASQMREKFGEIAYGVTMAWSFYDFSTIDMIRKQIASSSPDIHRSFEFCCTHLHSSTTKSLSELWHSILTQPDESKYDVDIELLSAEQCAVLILYPFWHRMGLSDEEGFEESGDLKRYLCALKSKCNK